MATAEQPAIGASLRDWRQRRRLTQLDLALDAGISTRHLSFVETGRSKPGREMLLQVLEQLEVPLREQNRMLMAAGHAPAFPEQPLSAPELSHVREALQMILNHHDPYPAIAVDRHWNIVASNPSTAGLTSVVDVDPSLLEPPVNAMRLSFHPRGLAPAIVNLGTWHAHFRERIERQLALSADEELAALLEEIDGYAPRDEATGTAPGLPGPLRVRAPDGGELSFFGVFATFDTPFEVTTSELAIELLFPGDATTTEAIQTWTRQL
jgi:transcriptional regulator with XRE-family HTH domain